MQKTAADNRRARYDYELGETFEAGIMLTGTEVKSLRGGKASVLESYAGVERNGDIFLYNANIPEYLQANRFNHAPKRPRKLLLHAREIAKLAKGIEREGMTIVPLRIYFNEKGRAKVAHRARARQEAARQARFREGARLVARQVAAAARAGVSEGAPPLQRTGEGHCSESFLSVRAIHASAGLACPRPSPARRRRHGHQLFRDGARAPASCPELWNVTHPERVRALHQKFVDAGADIILTNSFGANARRLEPAQA